MGCITSDPFQDLPPIDLLAVVVDPCNTDKMLEIDESSTHMTQICAELIIKFHTLPPHTCMCSSWMLLGEHIATLRHKQCLVLDMLKDNPVSEFRVKWKKPLTPLIPSRAATIKKPTMEKAGNDKPTVTAVTVLRPCPKPQIKKSTPKPKSPCKKKLVIPHFQSQAGIQTYTVKKPTQVLAPPA